MFVSIRRWGLSVYENPERQETLLVVWLFEAIKMKYLIVWSAGVENRQVNHRCCNSWDETKQIINDILHFPNCIYYAGPIWKTNAVL